MKVLLNEANARSEAVKAACNDYLQEEKIIKDRVAFLEVELEKARKLHKEEV